MRRVILIAILCQACRSSPATIDEEARAFCDFYHTDRGTELRTAQLVHASCEKRRQETGRCPADDAAWTAALSSLGSQWRPLYAAEWEVSCEGQECRVRSTWKDKSADDDLLYPPRLDEQRFQDAACIEAWRAQRRT